MAFDTELINVPSFVFHQDAERPITIEYYNGTITLRQLDNAVMIEPEILNQLFNVIKKNKPRAEDLLKIRK